MELLQSLLDTSSHAIFTLDREGIITHINQQAKNRFGLYNHSQHSHPAGRLEPGDLVLVADTEIGADDGELRTIGRVHTFAQAEAAVGYPFPEELKALLRETNGDHWLLWSAREIMENAKLLPGFLDGCDTFEEYLEKVARHIFFAGNGCGDYYCYRVLPDGQVDGSQIYIWEHETFEHHVVAKDIPDLIRKYYHDQC